MRPVSLLLSALLITGSLAGAERAGVAGDFGASLREVGAGIRNYPNDAMFGPDNPSDYYSESILRLTASGFGIKDRPGLGVFEFHLVGGMVKTSATALSGLGGLSQSSTSRRYRDDIWWYGKTWNESEAMYYLDLDRSNLKFPLSFGDLTVGRQAVTFGQTYFWNPLDVFNPFDARSFDRDYKPGVDVIRLDTPLGDFAGMNLVVASYGGGSGSEYRNNVFLFRCYGDVDGWDMAFQGGQIYGGNQFGGGLSGEACSLEVRGEAVWFKTKIDDQVPGNPGLKILDDSFTGVFGLGRKMTSGITVEAEYLYNGAGIPGDLNAAAVRVASGNALQMGRHLAGVSVSWEAMPLLTPRLACIGSFSDGSRALQPGFTYSLSNESELVAGAIINLGRRPGTGGGGGPKIRSEFGTNPDAGYLEFKIYF